MMSFKNCIRIRITSFWRLACFATLPLFFEQAFSSRWYWLNPIVLLFLFYISITFYVENFIVNKFSPPVSNKKSNIYTNKVNILNCCHDLCLHLFLDVYTTSIAHVVLKKKPCIPQKFDMKFVCCAQIIFVFILCFFYNIIYLKLIIISVKHFTFKFYNLFQTFNILLQLLMIFF